MRISGITFTWLKKLHGYHNLHFISQLYNFGCACVVDYTINFYGQMHKRRSNISCKAYLGGTAVTCFVSFSKAISAHRRASKRLRLVGETEGVVRAQRGAQILRAAAAPLVRDHGTQRRPHDTPGGLATGASRYDRGRGRRKGWFEERVQPEILISVYLMHSLWNNTWKAYLFSRSTCVMLHAEEVS